MGIREDILAQQDRPLRQVNVPEWGRDVWVGTMSGLDRDSFDGEGAKLRKDFPADPVAATRNFRARVLVRALFDEKGARIFADDDAARLGLKNAQVLDRLYDVAAPLNGLMEGDVESAAGESASAPSAPAGSASGSPSAEPPAPSSAS